MNCVPSEAGIKTYKNSGTHGQIILFIVARVSVCLLGVKQTKAVQTNLTHAEIELRDIELF